MLEAMMEYLMVHLKVGNSADMMDDHLASQWLAVLMAVCLAVEKVEQLVDDSVANLEFLLAANWACLRVA